MDFEVDEANRRAGTVRDIASASASHGQTDDSERQTVTAELRVTAASLARLLSITGSHSDFVLASTDGTTSVRVGLTVLSVPEAEVTLGQHGVVLNWAASTIAHGLNRVSLTRMELRLLVALMEFAPDAAPRRHLIARLWPADGSSDERGDVLAVWISALRRRFAAIGLPGAVRRVPRTGYCLWL